MITTKLAYAVRPTIDPTRDGLRKARYNRTGLRKKTKGTKKKRS